MDLSAAFDTVDHNILLNRLEQRLGITDKCLMWFRSYLHNCKQSVSINSVTSSQKDLCCGVPQGSVLGPKLFNVYMLPLGDIVRKHNANYHFYADNTQLYFTFKENDYETTTSHMEYLISDIRTWMAANMLKLNDDRTEVVLINGQCQGSLDSPSVTVGGEIE